MEFLCQQSSLQMLTTLAKSDRHSVLIEGPKGSGKTYLAKQYATMLGVSDFQLIIPKVDDIKAAVEECLQLSSSVVLCIENLDVGVPAASYTLLKFLEEPKANVYVVVTCRNIHNVPDTIASRSAVVISSAPVESDLLAYAESINPEKFYRLSTQLWDCIRTFDEVDTLFNMQDSHFYYFQDLISLSDFKDSVSNIVWKLGHYPDNSECPVELVIRYLIELIGTDHVKRAGIRCISDISQGRIASHAALAMFAFECKYCE